MEHLSKLNDMLRAVAASNGLQGLELDDSGTRTLEYQDTTIGLEYIVPAACLRFYSPLAAVNAIVPQDQLNDFHRALLTLNLSSPDLLGANFALHPADGMVVLMQQVPIEHLDAEVLEGHLNTFIVLIEGWTRKLVRGGGIDALLAEMTAAEAEDLSQLIGAQAEAAKPASADRGMPNFA
jgi:hypothetical protein